MERPLKTQSNMTCINLFVVGYSGKNRAVDNDDWEKACMKNQCKRLGNAGHERPLKTQFGRMRSSHKAFEITAGVEFELHFVDLSIRLHRNCDLFRPFLQMTSCGNWVTTMETTDSQAP